MMRRLPGQQTFTLPEQTNTRRDPWAYHPTPVFKYRGFVAWASGGLTVAYAWPKISNFLQQVETSDLASIARTFIETF